MIESMLTIITITISWILPLLILGIFGFLYFLYTRYEKSAFLQKKSRRFWYSVVMLVIVGMYLMYGGLSTYAQYFLWTHDIGMGSVLFNAPLQLTGDETTMVSKAISYVAGTKFGYFIFYSWGRFWFFPFLTLCFSAGWFGFLRALKKYNDRYFYEGETLLGFALALLVGWPKVLLFIPLTFFMVVFVSIYRGIRYKELYTSLGTPFLLAAAIAILGGNWIVIHTALRVFAITSTSGISLF